MATDDEVRQASERFYAALTAMLNGDNSLTGAVWAQGVDVTAMHPIGERGEGWDHVRSQFEQVGSLAGGGQVRLTGQLIRVGSDLAYEVGVEEGERVSINQRVTNIYRREGGGWKMVHHHSDVSPAMLDLMSRLQPPQ
jgi:ketosteroid isomerase-like protein